MQSCVCPFRVMFRQILTAKDRQKDMLLIPLSPTKKSSGQCKAWSIKNYNNGNKVFSCMHLINFLNFFVYKIYTWFYDRGQQICSPLQVINIQRWFVPLTHPDMSRASVTYTFVFYAWSFLRCCSDDVGVLFESHKHRPRPKKRISTVETLPWRSMSICCRKDHVCIQLLNSISS